MKVRYSEGLANHADPESCGGCREATIEALTGETGRPAIEPRNQEFGMPTEFHFSEGNTVHGVRCESCDDPARSETLRMSGSFLHRNREISSVSGAVCPEGAGKATSRTPAVYVDEKSDASVLPEKSSNKGVPPAEAMEGRDAAKGNTGKPPAPRTQSRAGASMGLDGVREVGRRDRRTRFTALMHHITPSLLVESFYALRRNAAVGVDGVTWREYEGVLYTRVHELHREIHTGTYRAQPSRRVYIPKADGRQRPLGIASLEDKIVQQAVSTVLGAIHEEEFLGFSYGFRAGRGQHDALDALYIGIKTQKVNWILDLDIRGFFDEISHEWMVKFLEHRIADKRLLLLIRKGLKAGVVEDGRRIVSQRGCPQGSVLSPMLANVYLHYVLDLWAHRWRNKEANGRVIVVRYADDTVLGFQHEHEARRFLAAVEERLGKFGLALNPEKTRLIEFGRYAAERRRARHLGKPGTFDFLGFTHCCTRSRRGAFDILRLTVKKRVRGTLKAIRETLLRRRHEPVAVVGRWLGQVLRGYYNYFAVPGNIYRLNGFRAEVERAWLFALRRRSQRPRMPWSRFAPLVERFLPPLRLVHKHPLERLRVMT